MAISKNRKVELLAQYAEWTKRSQALIMAEYSGLNMKDIDALRHKIREAGGEFHVMKNTLGQKALADAGIKMPAALLEGSTGVIFAFKDAPVVAKAVTDFAKSSERFKVKGGILDNKPMSADGVKALADLPPLPVMRAQLLGTLLAPASKLVRTLAEPGRSIAAVVRAYSEQEAAPAA